MWNKPLRNFCVAGVTALLALSVVTAAWPTTSATANTPDAVLTARVDQLSQVVLREHVLQLPEDAGVWHTTIIYPDKTPSDSVSRRLAAALAADDRLRSLLAQTKVHIHTVTDDLFRDRLQKYYGPSTPALIVQRPDGRVCFKASGANLPADARELGDAVAAAIGECRPQTKPAPSLVPERSLIPDLSPTSTPNSGDLNLIWLIALPLRAGLLGLYQEWKQSNV